jgi:ABC-type transport system substrate-binding protein
MGDPGTGWRSVIRPSAGLKALAGGLVVLLVAGFAAAAGGSPGRPSAAATPHRGGTLTVLETSGFAGAWPVGLDPATDTSEGAHAPYMDAIYGTLFNLGSRGKIIPNPICSVSPGWGSWRGEIG